MKEKVLKIDMKIFKLKKRRWHRRKEQIRKFSTQKLLQMLHRKTPKG